MIHPTVCPKCKVPWQHEENIYEYFRSIGKSKEEANQAAEAYGCTKENPKHFGMNVVGIEDPELYDGVSFWRCKCCNTKFSRWTMEEVKSKDNSMEQLFEQLSILSNGALTSARAETAFKNWCKAIGYSEEKGKAEILELPSYIVVAILLVHAG